MPRTRTDSPSAWAGVAAALALILSFVATPVAAAPAAPAAWSAGSASVARPQVATAPAVRTDELPLVLDPAGAPALIAPAGLTAGDPAGEAAHDHVDVPGAQTGARDLPPFVAIGFSWDGPAGGHALVTVHHADGSVSGPVEIDHDPGHGEDRAGATERRVTAPFAFTVPATAFEVVLPDGVRDVHAHLVRDDTSGARPDPLLRQAVADGIPGPEGIRTRESWGARPRKQTDPCAPGARYEGLGCVATGGVVNAVVHHTVNANSYTAAEVPGLLRSIQAFHQDAQGFDDIGYNLVVDRFGTIWEARAGGVDRPVVGGHTAGFNTGSVGVAVLGTFDGAAPGEAALDAVARIIAWKFAQRNVDPNGSVTVISNGGDLHDRGEAVTLNTIDGHRAIGATACPGAALFARLPDIRARVAAQIPLVTGELTGLDRTAGRLRLSGYALRRDTSTPVAVTLRIDGQVAAQTVANLPRLDVATRFPTIGAAHGFDISVPVTLTMRQACLVENLTGTLIGCRDVNPVTPPFGDFGFSTSADPPRIGLSGWIIDPDSTEPTVVHVYVDGVFTAQLWGDRSRPDVGAAYPEWGPLRGFSQDIPTTPGAHQVCVYGINIPAGAHLLLGCKQVQIGVVNRTPPAGNLDAVQAGGASVLVSGWALDRDTTEPLNVHVYVDRDLTPIVTSVPRPDVVAAFPGVTGRSGFSVRIPASPGRHTVCVYAIDPNIVGPHTVLGCRVVDVFPPDAAPPGGALDLVTPGTGQVTVAGWAIDPDTAAPISVHVYVGRAGSAHLADQRRDDVGAVFPAYGAEHGYSVTVPAPRGAQQVCVYAINNLATGGHTLLGCRIVTVT
jgi:hypothetical protein